MGGTKNTTRKVFPCLLVNPKIMANKTINRQRFRCSEAEFLPLEKAKTFLRLGLRLQPIDENGNPVFEPLRVEQPPSEAVAS
jgi:hypothetical protein